MENIQINGTPLQVPTHWGEVTLKTYETYINTPADTPAERVARLGVLCGLTVDDTLQMPVEIFGYLADVMQFATTEPNLSPKHSAVLDGVEYFANLESGGLTVAEWVDIKTAQKEGYNPLAEVLSIVLRPAGEKYNAVSAEARKQLFEVNPVSSFFGVLGFFLQCKTALLLSTRQG